MDLNAMLEIVISLAALFWLLSTVCSFVIEAVNSLVRNVRADALERFVCEMILGDGGVRSLYRDWKGRLSTNPKADPLGLLSHGLTASLRKPSLNAGDATTAPSYIPAEVFAKVLLDRLTTLAAAAGQGLGDCGQVLDELADPLSTLDSAWRGRIGPVALGAARTQGMVGAVSAIVTSLMTSPLPVAIAELLQLRAQLVAAIFPHNEKAMAHLIRFVDHFERTLTQYNAAHPDAGQTLTSVLGSAEMTWMRLLGSMGANAAGMNVVDAVRAVVEHGMLPSALGDALRPIIANANFDLAQVRKGIEDWFNSVMERATGWFKRNTTLLLFYLGVIVAFAANINPFLIWQDLTKDPALRGAGVAFANQVIEQQGDSILAQRILFSREAKTRDWEKAIKQAVVALTTPAPADTAPANPASAASAGASSTKAGPESIDDLARQIRPLLLRSGNFAGLLPQVSTPAKGPLGQSERKQFLEATCNAWHDAQISAGRVKKDDKPFAGLLSCPSLGEHFAYQAKFSETTEATTTVIPVLAPPPAPGASATSTTTKVEKKTRRETTDLSAVARTDNAEKFWSSADIVWDTRLATALWKAQMAARDLPAPGDRVAAGDELLAAFKATREQADEAAKRLANFLDRLPSVGWRWDYAISFYDNIWPQRVKLITGPFGWLLTGLMVSFGAAFWFDLLSKLMNRRVTGPRPDGVS